mmetsp:Transcript_7250/g.30898  ORF Transcript_7250/g.30898 Transcript_7250/m.30898 type:complete len:537 (-) Transcript_7250:2059-3669(-)
MYSTNKTPIRPQLYPTSRICPRCDRVKIVTSCVKNDRAYGDENANISDPGGGEESSSTNADAALPAEEFLKCVSSSRPSRSTPVAFESASAPPALDESVPPSTSSIHDAGFMPSGSLYEAEVEFAATGKRSMYSTNAFARLAPRGPKYTCHPPLCSRSRSSNMRKISREGWWMVEMTVLPIFATLCTSVMTMSAARESNPEVGSSRKNTGALDTNSTATVSTFLWPGERPFAEPELPIILPASGRSSKMSSASETKPCLASAVVPSPSRSLAENSSASATVANSLCRSICSQYAVHRAKVSFSTSCPLSVMVPLRVPPVLRPAMTSRSVVLPAPEAPMSASMRLGRAADVTDCRSCLVPPPASLAMFTVYSRSRHAMDIAVNFTACCSRSTSFGSASLAFEPTGLIAIEVSPASRSASSSVPARLDPTFITMRIFSSARVAPINVNAKNPAQNAAPPHSHRVSSSIWICAMMALPIVVHGNAPFAHSVATGVVASAGFAARYSICTTGLMATLASYESDKNSFWHSDRSEYAKREM